MNKLICKHCGQDQFIKFGKSKEKQRYKCKHCKRTFTQGDARFRSNERGRALAVLLYGSGKCSLRFIAKLLQVSAPTVIYWLRKNVEAFPLPEINDSLREVEFDEMWHFITEKNKKYGSGEQWTVLPVKPSDGTLGIVLLKASESSLGNSPI